MVALKAFKVSKDELRGQRVLVTGAGGFIGGRLVERLVLEEGALVRALVRHWHKAVWVSRFDVELHLGDMRDFESIERAVKGCDVVIHCANGGGTLQEYLATNVTGMKNLINACAQHKVQRLVFMSSAAVHGPNPPNNANESDAYRPFKNSYAISKIEAEKMALKAHKQGILPVVVLRPTYVWGPRSSLFTAGPLMKMKSGHFRLVDSGRGVCNAVFVEHVVDAAIAAAFKKEALGACFLVSDDFLMSWKEFFEPLGRILGKGTFQTLNSASRLDVMRCWMYTRLLELLERWKGNPAPMWRRVLRRIARICCDQIVQSGAMSLKDFRKFATIGRFDTSATSKLLGVASRYSFDEACSLTDTWVRDQMGTILKLDERQV